jgi:hypothetical protein
MAYSLKYNLHIHSCLSPCGSDDMTPMNLVNMCVLCGYEIIALTDHNSAANCPAAAEAAKEAGLLFLPGIELTTAEEVHVLCIFPTMEPALAFSQLVYNSLPGMENNPSIFGQQLLMDARDKVTGKIDKLLTSAAAIGIYDVHPLIAQYGGIALPAHIDRPSFSLLANLGFYDPAMGFTAAEVSVYAPPEFESPLPFITGSDAHDLCAIPDAEKTITVSRVSGQGVIDALRSL